jgi:hypothetical protein
MHYWGPGHHERIIVRIVLDFNVDLHPGEVCTTSSTTILGISSDIWLTDVRARIRVSTSVSISEFECRTEFLQGFDLTTGSAAPVAAGERNNTVMHMVARPTAAAS